MYENFRLIFYIRQEEKVGIGVIKRYFLSLDKKKGLKEK